MGSPSPVNKPPTGWIASSLSCAGWAALMAAFGLAAASLADADAIRSVADGFAPDGKAQILHWIGIGDARIIAVLREGAGTALALGAVLLAFRRPIARLLAAEPDVGGGGGRAAGIGWLEAAVAGCVFVTAAALAARNLDLPIRFDEAYTITQFATRSIWTILSDYHQPNNHVLHTLLVRAAFELLGDSPAALRTPAFLAACLTLPAVWWFVRREHGWLAAAFATALLGTSPFFIEYATNARGYTLTGLAFMALLLCGQGLVRRPEDHVRWGLFAVVTALGMFTHPLMVFPAAIATAWMVLVRWRETGVAGMRSLVVNGAVWGAAAVTLTGLLYAPVLTVWGIDALLFNEAMGLDAEGRTGFPAVLANAPRSWLGWHAATPIWAQGALLLALLVGAMAPRLPSGHRGVLALAVALGAGAVFLLYPVSLQQRGTLFLLLPAMIVAGAGAAFLVGAASARVQSKARLQWKAPLRSNAGVAAGWLRGEGPGAVAVLVVLGGFGWWATRPGVTEHFAWETGWSPNASALASAVDGELRPGDHVLGRFPTLSPVMFYLQGLGHDSSKVRVRTRNYFDQYCMRGDWCAFGFHIVGGKEEMKPAAPERFHLVVDEAGDRDAGPFFFLGSPIGERRPRLFPRGGGSGLEMVVDLPGAKVYRLRSPPDRSAGLRTRPGARRRPPCRRAGSSETGRCAEGSPAGPNPRGSVPRRALAGDQPCERHAAAVGVGDDPFLVGEYPQRAEPFEQLVRPCAEPVALRSVDVRRGDVVVVVDDVPAGA